LPQVINVPKRIAKLAKDFKKTPLLYVENHFLGVVKFKGEFKPHKHNRDEIFYVLDGKLIIWVNGRKRTVEPGDAILIRKGEAHASMCEEETHALVFEAQDIKIKFLED